MRKHIAVATSFTLAFDFVLLGSRIAGLRIYSASIDRFGEKILKMIVPQRGRYLAIRPQSAR